MAWKNWEIGDIIKYETHDFDGVFRSLGVVTVKEKDHLIVESMGMKLWVDETTADMFCKTVKIGGTK
jgi:hypothetical protein